MDDRERNQEESLEHRIDALYPQLADVPHNVLKVIDSTNQTVEETVDEIFNLLKK